MNLLTTCRKLFLGTTVYDMYLCAETKCGSRSIHRYVTTTDNDDLLTNLDRRIGIITISLHKIITCQELICGVNTVCRLARDVHEARKTCTGADKYGIEALFCEQVIDGQGTTDDNVGIDLYTELLYVLDFRLYDTILRKTELWNTIYENATWLMECLKDGYIVAELCKIACAGQSGRTGTDDGYLLAIRCARLRSHIVMLSRPVRYVTLELTDGDRLTLDTTYALTLALCLLRADTSAYCWKCRGQCDHICCCLDIAFLYVMDEARNVDGNRATLHAHRVLTLEATGRLKVCFFVIISETNLFEVCCSYLRILLADRNSILNVHSLPPDYLSASQPPECVAPSCNASIALPSSSLYCL